MIAARDYTVLERVAIVALAAVALAGCASPGPSTVISGAASDSALRTMVADQSVVLSRSDGERRTLQDAADALLARPLDQDAAVRVALLNSAELQALLADAWADAAAAAQSGRIANPVLTLERLRSPSEIEIGRMLAVGLLDLLTLPQRQRAATARGAQTQLTLTASLVERVSSIRQAWVNAVADGERARYAQQVNDSAEASAELARRMLAVGNFTKLQRARQHAFYADAAAQWAVAAHAATASREALVRQLGLNDDQAARLRLPERLPDLPATARDAQSVTAAAAQARLDVRIAQAALDSAARAHGLEGVASVTDIELSVVHNTAKERADGHTTHTRGVEVALRLPLFDWGELRRDASQARVLAAAYRLEASVRAAGSQLREAYSAYRTAHDLARHYRDEIVPLRKQISDENLLRYNGMLIGVFELLADSREQIASVSAAIDAQRQFWLADAALQSAIVGTPGAPGAASAPSARGVAKGDGDAQH